MSRVRPHERLTSRLRLPAAARASRWLSGAVAAAAAVSSGFLGCDTPPTDGVEVTLRYYDDTGIPPMRSHDEGVAEAVPESWLIAHAAATGEEVGEYGDNGWAKGAVHDLSDDELLALGGERVAMENGKFTFRVTEGPYLVCLSTGNIGGCHVADLPAQGTMSAGWGENGFWVSP